MICVAHLFKLYKVPRLSQVFEKSVISDTKEQCQNKETKQNTEHDLQYNVLFINSSIYVCNILHKLG